MEMEMLVARLMDSSPRVSLSASISEEISLYFLARWDPDRFSSNASEKMERDTFKK